MHVPDVAKGSSILKCQDQGGEKPLKHLETCDRQPNDLIPPRVGVPNQYKVEKDAD